LGTWRILFYTRRNSVSPASAQSLQIESLSAQLYKLTSSISSLEDTLVQKDGNIQTLTGKNRGLGKLLSNPSEKIVPKPVNQILILQKTGKSPTTIRNGSLL